MQLPCQPLRALHASGLTEVLLETPAAVTCAACTQQSEDPELVGMGLSEGSWWPAWQDPLRTQQTLSQSCFKATADADWHGKLAVGCMPCGLTALPVKQA